MEEEILNIEYHQKRLMLKALNKTGTIQRAAPLLGVATKTVSRLMEDWNIKRDPENGKRFFFAELPCDKILDELKQAYIKDYGHLDDRAYLMITLVKKVIGKRQIMIP